MIKNIFFELKQDECITFNNLLTTKGKSYFLDGFYFIETCARCDKAVYPIKNFRFGMLMGMHKLSYHKRIHIPHQVTFLCYICPFCNNNIMNENYNYEMFINVKDKNITNIIENDFATVNAKMRRFAEGVNIGKRLRFLIGKIVIALCVLFAAYKIFLIASEILKTVK